MAFGPDRRLLAATGTDGRIELMRASDGAVWRTIVHPGGAPAIAFSPDGTMLASGGYDRAVRLWRVADQQPVRVLEGHGGTIWSVAWSPDGSRIASSGEDRTIRIWRAGDGALLHTLRGHALNVWSVRFSPDSRLVASGSFDRTIRLWDVASRSAGATTGRARPGGGQRRFLTRWAATRERRRRQQGPSLACRGRRPARDADRRLRPCLRGRFQPGRALAGERRPRPRQPRHALAPADRARRQGPAVRLWRASDGALEQRLEHHDDVMALAFSPDWRVLATAGADGSNSLWRLDPILN